MAKSLIRVSPQASRYADEKVVDFDSPAGGGRVVFTLNEPDGTLTVTVQSDDRTVTVKSSALRGGGSGE